MQPVTERCLGALLDSANSDEPLRHEVIAAIVQLSSKWMWPVLRCCSEWLDFHPVHTVPVTQRSNIACAMADIVSAPDGASLLPADASHLLRCGVRELVSARDAAAVWPREALRLVVHLATLFPLAGAAALLDALAVAPPPPFVLRAVAQFAEHSPNGIQSHVADLFARLLPPLGAAREDVARALLSRACGGLAEAIARSSAGGAAEHAELVYSALHFFLDDYARSSDAGVRVCVAFALGCCFAECGEGHRGRLANTAVPRVAAAVRREKSRDAALPLRGLASCFAHTAGRDGVRQALLPSLDTAIGAMLHVFASLAPDETVSRAAAESAVLSVAIAFPAECLAVLAALLSPKGAARDAPNRRAVLIALRTIVAGGVAGDVQLHPFFNDVVAIVRLALGPQEDSIVRLAVVDCVLSLSACDVEMYEAVGFVDLLSYLITGTALPDAFAEVRDASRNGLTLLVSSARPGLEQVMWPFIFEHMREYTTRPMLLGAFTTVCSCVVQLAARVAQGPYFYVDFAECVNIPRPAALAVVFLTHMMYWGSRRTEDTLTVLSAATAVAPLIDDPIGVGLSADADGPAAAMPIAALWADEAPALQRRLVAGASRAEWEQATERLAERTVAARPGEEWAMAVAAAALALLPAYASTPPLLRAALVVAGIATGRSASRETAERTITTATTTTATVNGDDADYRLGVAACLAYTARGHADLAIAALQRLARTPERRGLFASRSDRVPDTLRVASAIGIGLACRRIDRTTLPSRLDTALVPAAIALARDAPGSAACMRAALLEGCVHMATAVRRLDGYAFRGREALLEAVIPLVCAGEGALRGGAITAAAALVAAAPQPSLSPSAEAALLDGLVADVKGGTANGNAAAALLDALLRHGGHAKTVIVLSRLAPLTTLASSLTRALALRLIGTAIADAPSHVCPPSSLGAAAAAVAPRLLDTEQHVRADAATAIAHCIRAMREEMTDNEGEETGKGMEAGLASLAELSIALREDGTLHAEKESVAVAKSLCAVLTDSLRAPAAFSSTVDTLATTALFDAQPRAALGAAICLHGLLRVCGGRLDAVAARCSFDTLIASIGRGGLAEAVRHGAESGARVLARHHPSVCLDALLDTPVPHSAAVTLVAKAIAGDAALCERLVRGTIDVILCAPPIAPRAVSAMALAGAASSAERGVDVCRTHRAALFVAAALQIVTAHAEGCPGTAVHTATALERLVMATADDEMTVARFHRYGMAQFALPAAYLAAVGEATRYLCRDGRGDTIEMDRAATPDACGRYNVPPDAPTPLVRELASLVVPLAAGPLAPQRLAAVCILGELLFFALDDSALTATLSSALLARAGADETDRTRRAALTALAAALPAHRPAAVAAPVAAAFALLAAALDADRPALAADAALAAARLAEGVAASGLLDAAFVTLVTALRAVVAAAECPAVRTAALDALRVFFALAGSRTLDAAAPHAHPLLAPLLLHCADADGGASAAAKGALRECLRFMAQRRPEAAEGIERVFHTAHMSPTHAVDPLQLYSDVAAAWVRNFPEMLRDCLLHAVAFAASPRESGRRGAAWIIGAFVANIPPEDLRRCGVEEAAAALMRLVGAGEKCGSVRAAAAKAIGSFSGV